jgi:hypothetical protein
MEQLVVPVVPRYENFVLKLFAEENTCWKKQETLVLNNFLKSRQPKNFKNIVSKDYFSGTDKSFRYFIFAVS